MFESYEWCVVALTSNWKILHQRVETITGPDLQTMGLLGAFDNNLEASYMAAPLILENVFRIPQGRLENILKIR